MSEQKEGWSLAVIAEILQAIDAGCLELARQHDCPEVRIYRQGFVAALVAVAQRLGVDFTPGQLVGVKVLSVQELRELVGLLELPLG